MESTPSPVLISKEGHEFVLNQSQTNQLNVSHINKKITVPATSTQLRHFISLVNEAAKLADQKMLSEQISEKLRRKLAEMSYEKLINITMLSHALNASTILTGAYQAWRSKMVHDSLASKRKFQNLARAFDQLDSTIQHSLTVEDPTLIGFFPPDHNKADYGYASNILTFDNDNNLLTVHSTRNNVLKQLVTWSSTKHKLLKRSSLDASIRYWSLSADNALAYATSNGITVQPPHGNSKTISRQSSIIALAWIGSQLACSNSHTINLYQQQVKWPICAQLAQTRVHSIFEHNKNKHLVAANNQLIKIWDITTQQCINQIHNRMDKNDMLALSNDGTLLGATSKTGCATLWDLRTTTCNKLPQVTSYLLFSTDNQLIATIGRNHSVHIWNQIANSLVTVLPHEQEVRAVCITADSSGVYTLSGKNEVALWHPYSGKKLYTFPQTDKTTIKNIFLSKDDKVLAGDHTDNVLSWWNMQKIPIQELSKLSPEQISLIIVAAQHKRTNSTLSLKQYPYLKKAYNSLSANTIKNKLPVSKKRKHNHRTQIIYD
jgi:WD40 repeat protein